MRRQYFSAQTQPPYAKPPLARALQKWLGMDVRSRLSPHLLVQSPSARIKRTPRPLSSAAWVLGSVLALACNGEIDNRAVPDEVATTGTPWQHADPESCQAVDVAEAPLRRLTEREIELTIGDVLQIDAPDLSLVADGRVGGFPINSGDAVEPLHVTKYAEAAEAVAARTQGTLAALAGCAEGGAACAEQWLGSVGRLLFRRSLSDSEHDRYLALFQTARNDLGRDDEGALAFVLRTLLQTPSFLYLGEVGAATSGAAGAVTPLRGLEIASRLSYLLWQSAPDADLLDAAEAGELDTSEGVEQHARRMLDDSRAERGIAEFHQRWLWLRTGPDDHRKEDPPPKDRELYPEYGPALLASMRASFDTLVVSTVREGGTLRDLLTTSVMPVDEALAPIFGVSVSGGLEATSVPSDQRAGVLTHPLTLTVHSHADSILPIWPGQVIRSQLLCSPLPPPPGDLNIAADEIFTPREASYQRIENPDCGGCHEQMDPMGFAFEQFDAIGRWRDPANQEVDPRGAILHSDDADGDIDGVADLSSRLSQSDQVHRCYTEKWFVFALGREPAPQDSCSLAGAFERFESADGAIEELILGLVTSDAFRSHRAPEAACR